MNRTVLRTLAVAAPMAALLTLTVGPATAEANGSPVNNYNRLRLAAFDGTTLEESTVSYVRFQDVGTNGDDSPIDTNDRAIVAHIEPGDFGQGYTNKSLAVNKDVNRVKNLSYDERADTTGAGAPRISVIFTNGDVAFLASSSCSNPIGVSSTWNRADFTGEKRLGLCSFNVSGATGGLYTSDGTRSAWTVYADTHPDQVVSFTFLVYDEPGDYTIDRLALGTNRLYGFSVNRAVNCRFSEARC